MRVLRALGYVALFLAVFFGVSFGLGILVAGVVADSAGIDAALSLTQSPVYLLLVFGVGLVLAVAAVVGMARLLRPSQQAPREAADSKAEAAGEEAERTVASEVPHEARATPHAMVAAGKSSDDAAAEDVPPAPGPPPHPAWEETVVTAPAQPPAPAKRLRLTSTPVLILLAVLLVAAGAIGALVISNGLAQRDADLAEAYLADVRQIALRDWEAGTDEALLDAERGLTWNNHPKGWVGRHHLAYEGEKYMGVLEDLQVQAIALSPPPEFVDANRKLVDAYVAAIDDMGVYLRGVEMNKKPADLRRSSEKAAEHLARANREFRTALRGAASRAGVEVPSNIMRAYPSN